MPGSRKPGIEKAKSGRRGSAALPVDCPTLLIAPPVSSCAFCGSILIHLSPSASGAAIPRDGGPEAVGVHDDGNQVDGHARGLEGINHGIGNSQPPARRGLKVIIDHTEARERNDRARLAGPIGLGVQVVQRALSSEGTTPLIAQQKENRQDQHARAWPCWPIRSAQINQRRKGGQVKTLSVIGSA